MRLFAAAGADVVTLTDGSTITIHKLSLGAAAECGRKILMIGIRVPKDKVKLDIYQQALGNDRGLAEWEAANGEINAIMVEFILKQVGLWPTIIADVKPDTTLDMAEKMPFVDSFRIVLAAAKMINWKEMRELGRAFFTEVGALSDAFNPGPSDQTAPPEAAAPAAG